MASQERVNLVEIANKVVRDYAVSSFRRILEKSTDEEGYFKNASELGPETISTLNFWIGFLAESNEEEEFRIIVGKGGEIYTRRALSELLRRFDLAKEDAETSNKRFAGEFWQRYPDITGAVFVVQEVSRLLGEERHEDEILLGMFEDSDDWKRILEEGINIERIFEYFRDHTEFKPFFLANADLGDLIREIKKFEVPPILRIKSDNDFFYPKKFYWALFEQLDDTYRIVRLSSFGGKISLSFDEFSRSWEDERGRKIYLAVRPSLSFKKR